MSSKTGSVASSRPETTAQASTHHTIVGKYKDAGFCSLCAALAAYAHQEGWTQADRCGECCQGRALPEYSAGRPGAESWVNGPTAPMLPACRVRRDGKGAVIAPERVRRGPQMAADSRLGKPGMIPYGTPGQEPKGEFRADPRIRLKDSVGLDKGALVRTHTPGSPRFHDRVGTVVSLNVGIYSDEVGLSFAEPGRITSRTRVDSWFAVHELNADLAPVTPGASVATLTAPAVDTTDGDNWGTEARTRADREMTRIARLPVSRRGSGRYPSAFEEIEDMPTGWIVSDPQPGYPWARTTAIPSDSAAVRARTATTKNGNDK